MFLEYIFSLSLTLSTTVLLLVSCISPNRTNWLCWCCRTTWRTGPTWRRGRCRPDRWRWWTR